MALFSSFFREKPETTVALALYGQIVQQSRRPEFYSQMGVADTLEGRFEVLILHAGIVMRHLTASGPRAAKVSQALFDVMFRELDQSLRELGVGDITIPKRIKAMGEAFYGRNVAYDAALSAGDDAQLSAALLRNVYRDAAGARPAALCAYVRGLYQTVHAQSGDDIADGRISFPSLSEG